MPYKSTQEMIDAIKYYDSVIEEIPDVFEVCHEYLIDGMTTADFIVGYNNQKAQRGNDCFSRKFWADCR